jgi:hypothetical protein
MDNNLLSEFVSKVVHRKRISFGDIRRLKRDILPDGIASREQAEALLLLDDEIAKAAPAWERWLVPTLVDFVVWAERPTGILDEDAAHWLTTTLANDRGTRTSKTGRLIAREIAEEAHAFQNDALAALSRIGRTSGRKSRRPEPESRPAVVAQL